MVVGGIVNSVGVEPVEASLNPVAVLRIFNCAPPWVFTFNPSGIAVSSSPVTVGLVTLRRSAAKTEVDSARTSVVITMVVFITSIGA